MTAAHSVPAIDPALAASLRAAHEREEAAARAARPTLKPADDLSLRELEVLHLVAGGYENREIAAKLHVSLDTVKTHLRHIIGKLGARNRAHAVHLAHGRRLL